MHRGRAEGVPDFCVKADGGLGGYRFDAEARSRIHGCVVKARIKQSWRVAERLISYVEHSIARYRRAEAAPAGSFRSTHDALRKLWFFSHQEDPPVWKLRKLIAELPPRALEEIDRRAPVVIARLLGIPMARLLLCTPYDSGFPRFREWARTADPAVLVPAARVLSADSAERVEGGRCGPDRRSAAYLEPRIMGEVRNLGPLLDHGGRPKPVARQELIRDLAGDWRRATGQEPRSGRSDCSPFGALVYVVFEQLGLSGYTAERALRQHWKEVKERLAVMQKRQIPAWLLPDFDEEA